VTASLDGARGTDGEFTRESADVEPGANLRFGFTNVSLDATVNPDFSQVETDASQVTVNERFALFYPEKRPFFLEGIELFATPNQLVYTRRIVDPTAGGKVTGKVGKTGIAVLSAADDTGDAHAWFNVARLRQDIFANSLAGLTYTDRVEGERFNRVLAADTRVVFKKLYYVMGQVGGSWTSDGGATRVSPMWHGEVDRTARRFGFNYKLTAFGDEFETQAGYVPRTNIVEGRASNRLTFYGARGAAVETFTGFLSFNRIWAYDAFGHDRALEGAGNLNLNAQLRGGWLVTASTSRPFVNFRPEDYDAYSVRGPGRTEQPFHVPSGVSNWSGTWTMTTPVFQRVNANASVTYGGTAIYAEAADGRQIRVSGTLGLRPTASIRIEGSLVATRITREADGSEYAQSTIPRLKVEYQPRRSLFFRAITEYRADDRSALRDSTTGRPILIDGVPVGPQRTRGVRVDLLASFEPTPGTVAFFGYGSSLAPGEDLNQPQGSGYARATDGFFLKLAYTIRR
jgi:hypothetical protein